jgi:hypothetical protein
MTAAILTIQDDRIIRLKRSLRRTQWSLLALLVVVVLLGMAWYGIGGIVQRQDVAKRIVAVDDASAIRVRVGENPKDTGRQSRGAGITLYDRAGKERGGMMTMDNGGVGFGLDAANIPPGQVSDRLGMMVDGKGNAMFMLADPGGGPAVMLRAGNAGGSMQIMQMSADQKQIQVRTLDVKGDTQSSQGS